jgi:hypothetical protein
MSPRVASGRPSAATMWMVGGRFGISSDASGGRCMPTQASVATPAMTNHRLATAPQ